jgi:hypothetical protein
LVLMVTTRKRKYEPPLTGILRENTHYRLVCFGNWGWRYSVQSKSISGDTNIETHCTVSRMKSTILNIAQSQAATSKGLPENVGRHAKRVDAALPGKHTRQLCDHLSWKEASVLTQLRTGMARLNGYLYRINVARRTSAHVDKQERP